MLNPPPSALIFDLDGTLWDSTEGVLAAWLEVFSEVEGLPAPPTREALQGVFGLRHDLIGARLLPSLEKAKQEAVFEQCEKRENTVLARVGGLLYPGVEGVLAQLQSRYRLFLVSNCQAGYIEACFAYHGLGRYFEDFESAGNTGLGKAENLRLVIERNRIGPAAYIGDTSGDRTASEAAGLPFVWAAYGFGQDVGGDAVVQSPAELLDLFPRTSSAKIPY